MNKPDEIIELYTFIEKNYPLENFNYKKINFWPMIRAEIGLNLNLNRPEYISKISVERKHAFIDYLKFPYRYFKYAIAKQKFITSLKPLEGDMQIFAYPQSLFSNKIEDKLYSRYLDPYYEVLKKKYPKIGRFSFVRKKESQKEYYFPIIFQNLDHFDKYIALKNYIDYAKNWNKKENEKISKTFEEVNDLVEQKFKIRPFYSNLIPLFNETINYKEYFDYLFEKSNVTCVFLECFYDSIKMGLCASAKENEIKVIEIQHGGAEDNVYVPYIKHNINYSVLPDYFWCWSFSDKDLIKKHNGDFKQLLPFVGGNMWLKHFMDGKILKPSKKEEDFIKEVRLKYKKVVLVTLQPVFISYNVIKECIEKAPKDFFFMIRFHPSNSLSERKLFLESIKGLPNIEFEISSTTNLYYLFKHADFQLTHSSTTAMEALVFNLPTVICSNYGYDFYKDQIKDEVILFTEDPEQINNIFSKAPLLNKEKINYYLIRSNAEEAINNVNEIIFNNNYK